MPTAREQKLFGHVARDDVPGHDDEVGEGVADLLDEGDEGFGVAVGDVDADKGDGVPREAHDFAELLPVAVADPEGIEGGGLRFEFREEVHVLFDRIVLVQRRGETVLGECARHGEGARRVHVGRDDGDRVIGRARVKELEGTGDVHFGAAPEGGSLRTDQNVLEVETNGILNVHGSYLWQCTYTSAKTRENAGVK